MCVCVCIIKQRLLLLALALAELNLQLLDVVRTLRRDRVPVRVGVVLHLVERVAVRVREDDRAQEVDADLLALEVTLGERDQAGAPRVARQRRAV